jgi:hypothetical protein
MNSMQRWLVLAAWFLLAAVGSAVEVTTKDKTEAFDPKDPAKQIGAFDAGTRLTVGERTADGKMYPVKYEDAKGNAIEALCRAEAIDALLQVKDAAPPPAGEEKKAAPKSAGPEPDAKSTANTFVNSLGMKFVPVAGIKDSAGALQNIWFSIWLTRVQDYQVFAEATKREWPKPQFEQTPADPAVNVSWVDATAFCEWLTEKERKDGKIKDDQCYRLPTDAEWNVAVGLPPDKEKGDTPFERSGKIPGVYPWGKKWPPPRNSGNYAPSLKVDAFEFTSPVGSFRAGKFGLFDMGGNVLQWCQDWYNSEKTNRVLRGSCWKASENPFLLSSWRFSDTPGLRVEAYGFRCVLDFGAK